MSTIQNLDRCNLVNMCYLVNRFNLVNTWTDNKNQCVIQNIMITV